MNDWLRTRNGLTLLLLIWGIMLIGGMLGTWVGQIVFPQHPTPALSSRLTWVAGGSLFSALVATVTTLRRRRREQRG